MQLSTFLHARYTTHSVLQNHTSKSWPQFETWLLLAISNNVPLTPIWRRLVLWGGFYIRKHSTVNCLFQRCKIFVINKLMEIVYVNITSHGNLFMMNVSNHWNFCGIYCVLVCKWSSKLAGNLAITASTSSGVIASTNWLVEKAMWGLQISQRNIGNTESKLWTCVRCKVHLYIGYCIACPYTIKKTFTVDNFRLMESDGKFLYYENFRNRKWQITVLTFSMLVNNWNIVVNNQKHHIIPSVSTNLPNLVFLRAMYTLFVVTRKCTHQNLQSLKYCANLWN